MSSIIIGVDISKHTFDCSYSVDGKNWNHKVFDNKAKGFQDFLKWISPHKVLSCHVVMEATGRYGEDLAEFLYAQGCLVSILNPAQIKYYSKSCLTRSKTDKVDSRLIADFASKHELKLWQPPTEEIKKLKALERCLESFKGDKTQIINRLEHEKDKEVCSLLTERLDLIEQQIQSLESSLKTLAKTATSVKEAVTLLQSIPGIGATTAFSLLGELPDLSTFDSAKQLSAYAGLNPSTQVSGSSVRRKSSLSKTGSRSLRKLLYFPAIVAICHNPMIKEFAERLKLKGKKPMVIIGAAMRKLLHIVFGVLKKQRPFQA